MQSMTFQPALVT